MTKPWNVATAIAAVFAIAIMTTSAALAAPGGNGNGNGSTNGNGNGNSNPPSVAATPELDSLVLFGTGAAGIASYALLRVRARRNRQDD